MYPLTQTADFGTAAVCRYLKMNIVKISTPEMLLKRQLQLFCQNYRNLYTGANTPKSEIKTFLNQYKSGSVRLLKQENGVAHIILDNPDRRNAISGKTRDASTMESGMQMMENWI